MKTFLYILLFAPAVFLAAIPWLWKVATSKNYLVDMEAWHNELYANIFSRPFLLIHRHLICGGDKSKQGW